MKTRTILSSLALSSALAGQLPAAAAPAIPSTEQTPVSPQAALAARIGEIAATPSLSPKEREEMIATALQLAITTAIAGISDPVQVLNVALQFTTVAVKAAPRFSEAIQRSAAAIPAIAAIPGGPAQIQVAVLETVMAAGSPNASEGARRGGRNREPEFEGKKDDIPVSPSR